MKLIFDVIYGNATINSVMCGAGMFEPSKRHGHRAQIEMSVNRPIIGNAQIDLIAQTIKDGLEKNGNVVSFVALRRTDGVKNFQVLYFSKDVNMISDGKKWGRFSNVLTAMGYQPETDERFFITGFNELAA